MKSLQKVFLFFVLSAQGYDDVYEPKVLAGIVSFHPKAGLCHYFSVVSVKATKIIIVLCKLCTSSRMLSTTEKYI